MHVHTCLQTCNCGTGQEPFTKMDISKHFNNEVINTVTTSYCLWLKISNWLILLWKLGNLAWDSKRIPLYTNIPQINTLLSSEILYHAYQTRGAKAHVINKIILEDDFGNLIRNEVNSPHLNMRVTSLCSSKAWWQEYSKELYKKDLHDPDNHNSVITHLDQTSWNVKSSGP